MLKDATGDILDRHVPPDHIKLVSKSKRKLDVDNPIYLVDKIIDHRGSSGNYEYLVHWKNYAESERTWEPQSSFLDDSVIKEYWYSLKRDK